MKRLMEMFEVVMIAVAYAEEGVSLSFIWLNDSLHKELEEPAWDLM